MQKAIAALKQHHANADREAFFHELLDVAPGLESYVRNRLGNAEHNGLIPSGLYTTDDILDDVFLYAYEHFSDVSDDESKLRVMLFQLANDRLDAIIREEAWHHDALSLEAVLEDELRQLNEIPQMTTDADGDIVMVEDLGDAEIEPPEPRALLLEDSFEDEIIGQLGLEGAVIRGNRAMEQLLARLYAELPAQSRIIFDLWTRGKLSIDEIASVRGLSVRQVQDVLNRIQRRFERLIAHSKLG